MKIKKCFSFILNLPIFALILLLTPSFGIAESIVVNFDDALHRLNFDTATLDFNGEDRDIGNGIPDAAELALVAAVLADPNLDFSANGGTSHTKVHEGYLQALASANADSEKILDQWPTSPIVSAGYALLGQTSFDKKSAMTSSFGAPLVGDYSLAIAAGEALSMSGDADGDGFSNYQEYLGSENTATFVASALNPGIQPSTGQTVASKLPITKSRTVGIVLYPGFEILDVYGPLEMWSYVPGFDIVLIAEEAGPVTSAQGTATIATHSFESAPMLDVLMVPGGNGSRVQLQNKKMMDYLDQANNTTEYTTSVCTGAALLAKAGILNGHRATTNKRFFFLAEQQSKEVDWVVDARWIVSGKMVTSSGVSAGTDMALGLVAKINGLEAARELASSLEYEWHEQANVDPFAQYVNRLVTPDLEGSGILVTSEPVANSTLPNAPQYLHLYFDRMPTASSSVISLYRVDATEKLIPLRGLHNMGNNDLMIEVTQPLPVGDYKIDYQASFDSGSLVRAGSIEFSIDQ